jgi:glycosyltransferase involved in cell wall biosynthesis
MTAEGRYCGEPAAAGCAACIAQRPHRWNLDIATWRATFGQFLERADRVIAPSSDVAKRIRRYFPERTVTVWPHPEVGTPSPASVARVVILGNLSPEKGLRVVAACAEDAARRGLPLTFRVLGSTTAPIPQAPDVPLSIFGQYEDSRLRQLLAAEKPDVIFFPAQVPETYSYTLSVALASRVPIVASSLGALAERLAGHPRSIAIRWNALPTEWNAALLKAAAIETETPDAVAEPLAHNVAVMP